jgi:hypothetical protein
LGARWSERSVTDSRDSSAAGRATGRGSQRRCRA